MTLEVYVKLILPLEIPEPRRTTIRLTNVVDFFPQCVMHGFLLAARNSTDCKKRRINPRFSEAASHYGTTQTASPYFHQQIRTTFSEMFTLGLIKYQNQKSQKVLHKTIYDIKVTSKRSHGAPRWLRPRKMTVTEKNCLTWHIRCSARARKKPSRRNVTQYLSFKTLTNHLTNSGFLWKKVVIAENQKTLSKNFKHR